MSMKFTPLAAIVTSACLGPGVGLGTSTSCILQDRRFRNLYGFHKLAFVDVTPKQLNAETRRRGVSRRSNNEIRSADLQSGRE